MSAWKWEAAPLRFGSHGGWLPVLPALTERGARRLARRVNRKRWALSRGVEYSARRACR